jgi:hypothetical protein
VLLHVPEPGSALLQLSPPEGRTPNRYLSPNPERVRSSSHFLTSRATTRRGRQGTYKPAIGSQAAIATNMICPLRHDSTLCNKTKRIGQLEKMMVVLKMSEAIRTHYAHTVMGYLTLFT